MPKNQPTKPTVLGEKFCQVLINALPSPEARIALVAALYKFSGRTIYLPLEKKSEARKREAIRLLKSGLSRPEVACAIQEQFGVSYRSATRDLSSIERQTTKTDFLG